MAIPESLVTALKWFDIESVYAFSHALIRILCSPFSGLTASY